MTQLQALKLTHLLQRRMLHIQQLLDLGELKASGKENEMISPKEQALIDGFNAATNAVGNRLAKLVAAQGMSPEAEAAFNAEISTLQGLGADPSNPIPVAG